jgi:hypothetical protein
MVHAALLLLMLEAVPTDLVFTISLKRSTPNLQISTTTPADYPICTPRNRTLLTRENTPQLGQELTCWHERKRGGF